MKILYITDPGIIGGATRSLIDVVSAMSDRGIECIVCTSSYNELNKKLNELDVENFASGHRAVMDIPAYKRWKKPLKKLIKRTEYYITLPNVIKNIEKNINIKSIDLIHTNSARNDIGCILSKKYDIPHIMHIREFGKEDFECIYYRNNYEKFINSYTTRFIAISQAVKNAWVSRGLDAGKVSVIYNGVDNNNIIPRTNENRDKSLSMVVVGGICEAKGQLQIIEAMGQLPYSIKKNVRLDLVGWGDPIYIKKIQDRARVLNIEDKICFLGVREDVYKILQNYQVGLTCSRAEGFGRVTVEYMHARLGVIVSNAGANTEIIHNGVNGLVYELNNIKDLAQCIIRYYCDRDFLQDMAMASYTDARMKYTKQINAENIYNEYTSVLKTRREKLDF